MSINTIDGVGHGNNFTFFKRHKKVFFGVKIDRLPFIQYIIIQLLLVNNNILFFFDVDESIKMF